jgi:hypothetical protein
MFVSIKVDAIIKRRSTSWPFFLCPQKIFISLPLFIVYPRRKVSTHPIMAALITFTRIHNYQFHVSW